MIEVKEALSKRDFKRFVDFPVKLYAGEKNYVPSLRGDELALRNPKKNAQFGNVDARYFLAYRDGEIVGRVAALIHRQHNELSGEKRIRFSRIDFVDDIEVVKALLGKVEDIARQNGLDTVHGPMGFSDMDREGLLVEGFDRPSTFVTQYSYEYYHKLIEQCGYAKEVDWVEYRLFMPPPEYTARISRIAEMVKKKYKLKVVREPSAGAFLKNRLDQFFEVWNTAYSVLYGVVPHNEMTMKQTAANFRLLLRADFICLITDEEDKPVGCGLIFPALGDAFRKCRGRLTPMGIINILRDARKPKGIELGTIGVMPEYAGKGVNAIIIDCLLKAIIDAGITEVETNPELENNTKVQSQWEGMEREQHKRRRAYFKKISE